MVETAIAEPESRTALERLLNASARERVVLTPRNVDCSCSENERQSLDVGMCVFMAGWLRTHSRTDPKACDKRGERLPPVEQGHLDDTGLERAVCRRGIKPFGSKHIGGELASSNHCSKIVGKRRAVVSRARTQAELETVK